MRTAVHSVVVELRMLARPLEIRSSPQPIATHGITALVTAMIAKPQSLPRQPAPKKGLRRKSRIATRPRTPKTDLKSSRAVGLMSCTVSLMARKEPPQIRDRPTNARYGSRRLLDTCRPVVAREHEGDGAIVL